MAVIATRDIAAGEELTWQYLLPSSRAILRTSFGFGTPADAPAASLAATDLPHREALWLQLHGCDPVASTDLELNGKGVMDDDGIRKALRCIRLRLYSAEEAEWALSNQHLDMPWAGDPVTDGACTTRVPPCSPAVLQPRTTVVYACDAHPAVDVLFPSSFDFGCLH